MANQQKQAKQTKEGASKFPPRSKSPLDNVDKVSEKEDKTLSNLSSGDTKQCGTNAQDDTKLQLERSASLAVDTQLPKCEIIGCNGHATGHLKIFEINGVKLGRELNVCAECYCKSKSNLLTIEEKNMIQTDEALARNGLSDSSSLTEVGSERSEQGSSTVKTMPCQTLKTLKDLNKYKLIREPVMMHPTKDGDWVELSDLKEMAIKWLRATKQVGTAQKLADYKNIETANAVYEAIENIVKHLFDVTEEDLYGRAEFLRTNKMKRMVVE